MARRTTGAEARWAWKCHETAAHEIPPCGFMLHTDIEMLYEINAIDEDGFADCNIGEGERATGEGNPCPIDSAVEGTVNKYVNVNSSPLLPIDFINQPFILAFVCFRAMMIG